MSAVAGRRTYTEDELQAALRDIQSGKLGTRRAAVIYGIPRSTLRNKVYKLALEKERESHLNTSTPPNLKLEDDEAMDDDKELSGAEEEKEVEKALQAPLLSIMDLLRFGSEQPEALKVFLQKAKESQDTGPEQTEVIHYIQAFLASQNLLANQKRSEGSVLNHLVPDFGNRLMTEEHFMKMHSNGDSERLSRPSPSNSVITKIEKKSESEDMDDDSPSSVILKIPSFVPTSSKNGHDIIYRSPSTETPSRLVSPPVNSDSGSPPILPGKNLVMKDLITQSISQKFQQSLAEPPIRRPPMSMEIDCKRGGFTPPMGNMTSVIKSQHDLNRQFQQRQMQRESSASQGSGQPSGGKGTRPKRGKYRNYDRDSLVEAVRAVQRGEMSVHRAGSYYGVPHSTLEYKVKERHLMRPRKRDPKPNPVDEKIASLKQNDLRIAQEKLKPAIKPPQQKFSPTSPNGMKLPIFDAATSLNPAAAASLAGYNHPPFPFWPHPGFPHNPLEYAAAAARNPGSAPFLAPNPEFFASQMMQKLQEESSRITGSPSPQGGSATLVKSARQMAESLLDGSGSNGSFLDGIIRSSLESGVRPANAKSVKEEKNVAPENMSNKALLDQLCRNSRLTPLPKPDSNSSEDESYRKESSPLNFSTGMTSQDENSSRSPTRSTKENSDLTNDEEENHETKHHPRIYLKKDLVNPDNLKPQQLLVRFPELLTERNGGDSKTEGSDNEAPQD